MRGKAFLNSFTGWPDGHIFGATGSVLLDFESFTVFTGAGGCLYAGGLPTFEDCCKKGVDY